MADNNSQIPSFDDLVDDFDPQSAVAVPGAKMLAQKAYESQPVQNVITGEGLKDYNDMLTGAIAGDHDSKMALAQHNAGVAMGSLKMPEIESPFPQARVGGKIARDLTEMEPSATQAAKAQQDAELLHKQSLIDAMMKRKQAPEVPSIKESPLVSKAKPVATKVLPNYGNVTNDISQAGNPSYGKVTWDKGPEQSIGKVVQVPSSQSSTGKVTNIPLESPNVGKITQVPDAEPNYGNVNVEEGPEVKPNYGKVIQKPYAQGGTVRVQQPASLAGDLDPWFAEGGVAGEQSFDSLQSDPKSQPIVDNQAQNQTTPQSFDSLQDDSDKYGTLEQQGKAALEGLGQGLVGPIAPAIERGLGIKPEDIRGRAEENPGLHYGSEILGLTGPALVTGGASAAARFTQAGALKAIGEGIGFKAGDTLASRIGTSAAQAAIDNMLIAGSDETSKLVLQDPDQSAQTALVNIGLSGLIGGGVGAAFGSVSPLWKATQESKAGQVISDFKARVNEHIANPNPVEALKTELTDHYKGTTDLADEVYGPTGLKAQDIAKAVPKYSPKMTEQAQEIIDKVGSHVQKMKDNPSSYPARLTTKLENDLDTYVSKVIAEDATPAERFNAAQDLKQQLQGYSKFDKFVKPVDEAYDFVTSAKELARDLREKLEDPKVWGKAADRQVAINKAFVKYLPALKDFESKFTTEIGGERVVDPTKVNTYINQLGKPNAEIKQQMLKNFLDQSEKYKQVIAETHANLGIDNPIPPSSLNFAKSTLKEKTLGSRIADAFIEKGLTSAGGKAIGGGLGGAAGSLIGHPVLGTIAGGHALGPFFSSVLPSLTKSVLGGETSAEGFKVAADYVGQVNKGNKLLNNAAKGVFNSSVEVLPSSYRPSNEDLSKLDRKVAALRTDVAPMLKENALQHYLPGHDQSVTASAANAVSYLNSIRASTDKVGALDNAPVPSSTEKATYKQALTIAQQPLVLLDKIKEGTITANDIQHLQMMYPSLYQGMQQKLTNEMTDALHEGKTIPYKTRIGLSMFMAQPLDSTMSPAAITAAQPTPQGPPPQAQRGQSKGRPSSPALQKLPDMYKTGNQSRIQRQQLRK